MKVDATEWLDRALGNWAERHPEGNVGESDKGLVGLLAIAQQLSRIADALECLASGGLIYGRRGQDE